SRIRHTISKRDWSSDVFSYDLTVGGVAVTGPYAGTQAVVGVASDADGLVVILDGHHGQHRAEDLLLEDPHIIGALENRRLDVVAVLQPLDLVDVTAGEGFGTLLRSDLQVGANLVHLLAGGLGAHLGFGVQRVALLDSVHALHAELQELVSDGLVDQRAGRAGAD